MMAASVKDSEPVVDLLLLKGADVNMTSKSFVTYSSPDMRAHLLQMGTDR